MHTIITLHITITGASSRASSAAFDLGVESAAQHLWTLRCPTHAAVEHAGLVIAFSACCILGVVVQHHRLNDGQAPACVLLFE